MSMGLCSRHFTLVGSQKAFKEGSDPSLLDRIHKKDIRAAMTPSFRLSRSGYITQGPAVEEFEAQLRGFFGNPFVLTTNR